MLLKLIFIHNHTENTSYFVISYKNYVVKGIRLYLSTYLPINMTIFILASKVNENNFSSSLWFIVDIILLLINILIHKISSSSTISYLYTRV